MIHIEIVAEKIWSVFGFPVTNTLLMSWIVMILLIFIAFSIRRRAQLIPAFMQNLFEVFIDGALDLLESIFSSRAKAEKYFPFIATIFLFILLSNWLGIVPGIGSIGILEKAEYGDETVLIPFFRSAASDLNFTLAIAIISVFATHIFGIAAIGIFRHASRFISLKSPIAFFVGILELISEIAKIISFSFRLFGNIFAGEVLLIIMGFLVPFVIPVTFLGLEVFVGFIQALVFAMLTMIFIAIATTPHGELRE